MLKNTLILPFKLVADSIMSEAGGDSEVRQCANCQGPTISIQTGLWPWGQSEITLGSPVTQVRT